MPLDDKNNATIHDAFISYSRKDKTFASKLEKALESFRPPKDLAVPQRHLDIFRDEQDMTGSEYQKSIREHLSQSAGLIVVCSPDARRSTYVNDEIRLFVKAHGTANIILIILSGMPNNEVEAGQEGEMAFPDALCDVMQMPLAQSYLGFNPQKDKVNKGMFEGSWYTILANLYGLSRSEIEQRDKRRQARVRKIAIGVTSAVVLALTILTIWALISRKEAIEQRLEAERQSRQALARQLTAEAELVADEYPGRARLLALEARATTSRAGEPAVQAAMQTLRTLLTRTGGIDLTQGVVNGTQTALSSDGRWLVTGDSNGALAAWDLTKNPSEGPATRTRHHRGAVDFVLFTYDSRRLITASRDGSISAWSFDPSRPLTNEVSIFQNSEGVRVNKLLTINQDRLLLAGFDDGTIRLWKLDTNNGPQIMQVLTKGETPISRIVISPDGNWLVVAHQRGSIILWKCTGTQVTQPRELHHDGRGLRTIAFSPDSQRLVTTTYGKATFLWELSSNKLHPTRIHSDNAKINGAMFLKDGSLVTYTGEGAIELRNSQVEATAVTRVFQGPQDPVEEVVQSPNGTKLLSLHGGGKIFMWHVNEQAHKTPPVSLDNIGTSRSRASFSDDGELVAVYGTDNVIRLWSVESLEKRKPPTELRGHDSSVRKVVFSANKRLLVSSSSLGGVRIWNIRDGERTTEPRTLLLARWAPFDMSANGRWLALGDNGEVKVFHVEPGIVKSVYNWRPDESSEASLKKVAISSSGSWFAAGFSQGTIWLQKLGGNRDASPRRLSYHSKAITVLQFTPGEDHLFASDKSGSTSLWNLKDLNTSMRTITLPAPLDHKEVVFSSDSRWMVTGYKNGAMVWDLSKTEPIGIPIAQEGDRKTITAFAINPSRPQLVTGHLSGLIKTWHLDRQVSKKPFNGYTGHASHVTSIAIGTGTKIATGSSDRTAIAWDLSTLLGPAHTDSKVDAVRFRGHETSVSSIAINEDEHVLATGSINGTIRLWPLDGPTAGSEAIVLHVPGEGAIKSLQFSADGHWLVSESARGIHLWAIKESALTELACTTATRNMTWLEWEQYFPNQMYRKTCQDLPVPPAVLIWIENQAKSLASLDDRSAASSAYSQGAEWSLEHEVSFLVNKLCWSGATHDFPAEVLPACEHAVSLAPNNASYRDGRGLARALTGNYEGAITDFTEYVRNGAEQNRSIESVQKREHWIEELKRGLNPFDDQTLEAIRKE